ncbi:hypothetical protein K402DRAFT_394729, partial [Aulographum hederae CBS 113979]
HAAPQPGIHSSIHPPIHPSIHPDLNAIEPCWFWMKRWTTKKGAPKSRAEAIRAWIERIPRHIKEIIRCEGGNEYREGREHVRRAHE